MNYTKGENIKQRFVDALVSCELHFDTDQLVKVLDICDELGIPDMYEALKAMADIHSPIVPMQAHAMADKALAKAEGKP